MNICTPRSLFGTVKDIQYSRGISSRDTISTMEDVQYGGRISSVQWRDTISTAEDIPYCGRSQLYAIPKSSATEKVPKLNNEYN